MGQAWCKEKSSKAQDSKSPLDRVFVRCAHRIYPSLKEEGSVLGGATQRVTSSEIGYAVSPPRSSMLHRGLSIDSVDRPFHPSEWVDVNLEVPCSPRDSVVLTRLSALTPELLQKRASSPSSNSLGSRRPKDEDAATGTPVPPPRRRRRSRRPLPPEPGPEDPENNSRSTEDEFGHYSQLQAAPGPPADYEEVASKNSDDEFMAIEESLMKRSMEDASHQQPEIYGKVSKNSPHGTSASLPNYARLEGKTAERPPRHVKTASLPRDTSFNDSPQSPESRAPSEPRIEEARCSMDNSIFKAEEEFAGQDVKTSTPFKPTAPSVEELQKDEISGNIESDGSASLIEEQPINDDPGYETKSSVVDEAVQDASRSSELYQDAAEELSSGISRDATVNDDESVNQLPQLHRTISEESFPREMLVDDLDEVPVVVDALEKSSKDASSEIARQASVSDASFKTPPPSPSEMKSPDRSRKNEETTEDKSDEGNPVSTSLTGLEAALTDMLLESSRVMPDVESNDDHEFRGNYEPTIDLPPRNKERINPFNDSTYKSNDSVYNNVEDPPEKPIRLYRINLDDSAIEEPLIVPTPPKRRHRSKSNLNTSANEVIEALRTYGNDRLI